MRPRRSATSSSALARRETAAKRGEPVLHLDRADDEAATMDVEECRVSARWGVAAERKPLESVCRPLAAAD